MDIEPQSFYTLATNLALEKNKNLKRFLKIPQGCFENNLTNTMLVCTHFGYIYLSKSMYWNMNMNFEFS